jgi:hypothetical protein
MVREQELLNLVGVGHAAGFQNVETPVAFPIEFDIPQEKPGIDQRRYLFAGVFKAAAKMGKVRKESGYFFHLQMIDQAR